MISTGNRHAFSRRTTYLDASCHCKPGRPGWPFAPVLLRSWPSRDSSRLAAGERPTHPALARMLLTREALAAARPGHPSLQSRGASGGRPHVAGAPAWLHVLFAPARLKVFAFAWLMPSCPRPARTLACMAGRSLSRIPAVLVTAQAALLRNACGEQQGWCLRTWIARAWRCRPRNHQFARNETEKRSLIYKSGPRATAPDTGGARHRPGRSPPLGERQGWCLRTQTARASHKRFGPRNHQFATNTGYGL